MPLKIPLAHHWRLINKWLENIVRLPEASNKYPARKYYGLILIGKAVLIEKG